MYLARLSITSNPFDYGDPGGFTLTRNHTCTVQVGPFHFVKYPSPLNLLPPSSLLTEEVDFAFGVWRHFPERIVGFEARSVLRDREFKCWTGFKFSSRYFAAFSFEENNMRKIT